MLDLITPGLTLTEFLLSLPFTSKVSPDWGRRYLDQLTDVDLDAIEPACRYLTDGERAVLRGLYIDGFEQQQLADLFGVTRTRIARVKRTAFARIGRTIRDDMGAAA